MAMGSTDLLAGWGEPCEIVVVDLEAYGAAIPSLLSSVPGRPRGAMGGEGWNLGWAKGFVTASEWRAAALHVYVWGAKDVRVTEFAWLTGALGLRNLNQAIGFVRAFSGSGSGWEMRMAREQASGKRAGALFTTAL